MKKVKRIMAIIGIILLVSLYLITLICAITDNSNSMSMFAASVFATVVIPVLIWAYTFIYRLIRGNDDKSSASDSNNASKKNSDTEVDSNNQK